MLSLREAHERALRHAVLTGQMADMSFIHSMQRADGHIPCFGRMEEYCPHTTCRWHPACMSLLRQSVARSRPALAT